MGAHHCRCGSLDEPRPSTCSNFLDMVKTLERTSWLKDFKGKVRGNLEGALQRTGRAMAVCIEGGPVTQVEHFIMKDLVSKVLVYDRDDLRMDLNTDIEFLTFDQFQRTWRRRLEIER